jgi:hypothetical protein
MHTVHSSRRYYHIFADETYYYKNTEQWPLILFDSHWHAIIAMCVYIKKYVSSSAIYFIS